jgi:hypothetical protein
VAHLRLHVEPDEQLTEQEPVQLMLHVEFPVHETLPLGPTVSEQLEPDAQLTLQESAQLPLQTL